MGGRRKSLDAAFRDDRAEGAREQKVLVADDDQLIRTSVREGLSDAGYVFVECHDGTEVLSAIRQHQPDLLILDVEMPKLGGVEVCRIVKANQSTTGFGFIPVILMTARRTGKVEGLELGADDYLIKPFDMLELSARVKSMLRLKALQDQLVEKNRELDRANKELEERRQELLLLSRTDGLTGLVNRRHFEEQLLTEFARSQRYRAPLSCVLIDVDHFKRLNDTYGHPFGDLVLREIAHATRRALRDVDVLARYGGEELVALLPETATDEAMRVAERIRQAVETLHLTAPTPEGPKSVRCTVSAGVATCPSDSVNSPETLVQAADECLYAAKAAGRNQVRQAE